MSNISKIKVGETTYDLKDLNAMTYADNGVLGAKNLLLNDATSKTIKGVTFTVNADKTITINGTQDGTGDGADIYINGDNVTGSRPKLSDYPSKFIYSADIDVPSTITIGIWFYDTSNTFIGLQSIPTGQSEVEIIPPDNAVYFVPYVRVNKSQTVSDITVGVMFRLASDPDDTYVPYAMTNRELTEVVTPDKTAFATVKGTATVNTIVKTGNIVVADLRTNGVTTAAWESIATIPAGYRPANNVWFVANDMTGGSLIRCALNADGTVTCPSAISNKEIYIHAFWSIV